jgi:hypothetical protein
VRDLAKLDLDPNTVYNVSLSVAQGNKKFDNLRFFQTKTPKLFNIVPGQYSTFSRLTTALEPVIPNISGGVYTPAQLQDIDVTDLTWYTDWQYDVSEGTSSYRIEGSSVIFTITVARDPQTFVFSVDGFPAKFACLNGRSDWKKINETTYEVRLPVREYKPDVFANPGYKEKDTGSSTAKYNVVPGQSLIYLKSEPKGCIAGLSTVTASGTKGKACFAKNTKAIFVQREFEPYYIIVNPEVVVGIPVSKNINFSSYVWSKGLDKDYDPSGSINPPAQMHYYSSPVYSAIRTTYDFKGNSSISTEILNSTVLDSLIWEENIRDFVYFFISDTASTTTPAWYYFSSSSNNGGITAANLSGTKIGGTLLSVSGGNGDERTLNPPPPAPGSVENVSSNPSYPPLALKARAKFYEISKLATASAVAPALSYPISIRFGIARYTKNANGTWTGAWNGVDNKLKNVLSQEELVS